MFDLVSHGPDTFVGEGPRYPWGGLYGGQVVAQALRAASSTVDDELLVHSLRAYFIRRGDHTEPVRYEVDRIRNGRSFVTRRVVARQAIGAILNLEASFQREEHSLDLRPIAMPIVPGPEDLVEEAWSKHFARRFVPSADVAPDGRDGMGRVMAWMRVHEPLGESQLMHRCWLAYLSDDLSTDAVVEAHPQREQFERDGSRYTASLDHAVWFHRPVRADVWHLHDISCHAFAGGRGLSMGYVFGADGAHVATIAQEVLLRDRTAR
ncbi:MAG: acyl-CoA thioesterase domain-containing protein [Ilumatobacteraceae bacterium]